jgi:N-acetyl-1-D-myo-inositol-2-amino-2-deoxy-alpha-D-glucopyranoside deacetylase
MGKQKTLIFFGAHPDDETFGIGATLAQYASSGVKVYYVCSTHGEAGTVDSELLKGYDNIAARRYAELKCAAEVLGLTSVIHLGYRDSGMRGSRDNRHPDSLSMAHIEDVTAKMVKIIRELKPDVVITHDASGGYGHPDHIVTHNAAVAAFYAANDAKQYPEAGPTFQPAKLYFGVRSQWFLKVMVKILPLVGQNPHGFGRNKDIDLTKISVTEYPIHAVISLNQQAIQIRDKAAACHVSQGGARPVLFRILRIFGRFGGQRDYFMRVYPPPTSRRREKDLFEGLKE